MVRDGNPNQKAVVKDLQALGYKVRVKRNQIHVEGIVNPFTVRSARRFLECEKAIRESHRLCIRANEARKDTDRIHNEAEKAQGTAQWPDTNVCPLNGKKNPPCEGCTVTGCARGEHILNHRKKARDLMQKCKVKRIAKKINRLTDGKVNAVTEEEARRVMGLPAKAADPKEGLCPTCAKYNKGCGGVKGGQVFASGYPLKTNPCWINPKWNSDPPAVPKCKKDGTEQCNDPENNRPNGACGLIGCSQVPGMGDSIKKMRLGKDGLTTECGHSYRENDPRCRYCAKMSDCATKGGP